MAERALQQNGEDYQRLSSIDHSDQFDEEERIEEEDGPMTLDKNDFSLSSNIAVPTEGDMGVSRASNTINPGGSSNISNGNDRLFLTTKRDCLSVKFVEAELKENYGMSKMDPYCVMKVGSEEFKTETCRNGSKNPRWTSKFDGEIPPSVCFIFIEIFDKNTLQSDDKIAWTSIPMLRLVENGKDAAVWYDLSGKQGRNREGRLQLITTYTPNISGRIPEPLLLSSPSQITHVEAQQEEPSQQIMNVTESVPNERNENSLSEKDFNSKGGNLKITGVEAQLEKNYGILLMDPYCVIKVGPHELRTSVCQNGSTKPKWHEKLECCLPSAACIISIEIFDSNSVIPDKRIAWTSVLMKEIVQTGGETTNWYPLSGEEGEEKEGKIQLCIKYEKPSVDNDDEGIVSLDKITTFLNVGKTCLAAYTGKIPDKMNIILMGRGGSGKSSVGNTLLGRQCFSTRGRQNTVQLATLQKGNFEVNVMDTPNLFDEDHEMNIDQKVMEIVKTAMDFPDGIHLFLIVCRGDVRLRDEEQKMLTELKEKYGESVYDHLLLVLTHAKDFLRDQSLEEVLKGNKDLWNVCTYVRGRVIAIENIQEELPDKGQTVENQQTQLLHTIFEVIRLQHKPYENTFFHAVNEQMVQRERKHKSIIQAYDSIFDHTVNTISSKSDAAICEILKRNDFAIDDLSLRSNNERLDSSILRRCIEWCIRDLETFINLVLTETRLKQSSNGEEGNESNYALITKYKERSLQTSKLIKANRQKLINLFNIEIEEKVRSFFRLQELSDINKIMNEVDKNIAQCQIYNAILDSLPGYFKSEEWITDVKNLSLQTVHEYLEIKSKVWPNSLILDILGRLGITAGYASILGAVGVGYAVGYGFIVTTGAAAVAVVTFGTAGIALLVGAGIAGTAGGLILLRKATNRSKGNKDE